MEFAFLRRFASNARVSLTNSLYSHESHKG